MRRFGLGTSNAGQVAVTAIVCLALYLAAGFMYENFFSLRTFSGFFSNNAVLGIVAVGMTFVILSGGIDLSVGAVAGCATIALAAVVEHKGWSPSVAVPAVLGCGAIFGGAMGWLIHNFRMPPFIVTLAGMFFARGLAYTISGESIGIRHSFFNDAYGLTRSAALLFGADEDTATRFGSLLPTSTCAFLLLLALAAVVIRSTRFGRNVYAVGGSERSALLMGLPAGGTKIGVYAISGFCAALGGVVHTVTMFSGNPSAWIMLELDAIAAVVIGGTLLTGGAGSMVGTLLGVIVFAIIAEMIRMDGRLSSWWTSIVAGALLLAFILIQRIFLAASRRSQDAMAESIQPPQRTTSPS